MMKTKPQLYYTVGGILLAASVLFRYLSAPVITGDYSMHLSLWFTALQPPGLSVFKTTFADYTPLYLYMLKLLTYIPVYSLYSIKNLSLVFDIVMAIGVTLIVREYLVRDGSEKALAPRLFLAFAIVLAIPTVIINSSLWAQSDSIYAAGIIFSLYFMLKDEAALSVLCFAFAFSDKLQAIFFAPILLGYLCRNPKRLWLSLIVPAFFILSLIPAWIGGGNFLALFKTYISQGSEYSALTLNAPTIYAFLGERIFSAHQTLLALAGIGAAALASLVIAAITIWYADLRKILLSLSLFAFLIIPFFLPHMHERYFYLADVMAVTYALIYPKRWYLPVLVIAASLGSYANYLQLYISGFSYIAVPEWILGFLIIAATFLVASEVMAIIMKADLVKS
jgi:Gpi18-like mannosyltransferase